MSKSIGAGGIVTNFTPAQEVQRKEFTKYVDEIAAFQRNALADRVSIMQRHIGYWSKYFFGSMVGSCGVVWGAIKMYGPRHITNHRVYVCRPIGPTLAMGWTVYTLLYTVRLAVMKMRFWTLVEDYEYEMKKSHAHHVQEGMAHLAFLQFLVDQIKHDKADILDVDKIRIGPQ